MDKDIRKFFTAAKRDAGENSDSSSGSSLPLHNSTPTPVGHISPSSVIQEPAPKSTTSSNAECSPGEEIFLIVPDKPFQPSDRNVIPTHQSGKRTFIFQVKWFSIYILFNVHTV